MFGYLNRDYTVSYTRNYLYNNFIFRIELIPCFDISGPTLAINVNHAAGSNMLQLMLQGEIDCNLPKMTAQEMEDNSLFHCEYQDNFISIIHNHRYQNHVLLLVLTCTPIRRNNSGLGSLNKNQDGTKYMLTLLALIGTDRYQSFFSLNRSLYRKYILV